MLRRKPTKIEVKIEDKEELEEARRRNTANAATNTIVGLGGFKNVRNVYDWKGLNLEVDETGFDFGTLFEIDCESSGPEEAKCILEEFLKENEIDYSYSVASKFAIFRAGKLPYRVKEAELEVIELQKQLVVANKSNEEEYEELNVSRAKNENAESKLRAAQTEAEELISRICSLEEEIEKERALSADNLAKCEKLEEELLRVKRETQLHQDTEILHREGVDSGLMFKHENELALAASRFSECWKTIESLGQQLKSLATLEDFILDSEDTMDLTSDVTPPGPQDGGEKLKLHNSDLNLLKTDSESSASLNPSISFGKSHFSFGRFYPTRA